MLEKQLFFSSSIKWRRSSIALKEKLPILRSILFMNTASSKPSHHKINTKTLHSLAALIPAFTRPELDTTARRITFLVLFRIFSYIKPLVGRIFKDYPRVFISIDSWLRDMAEGIHMLGVREMAVSFDECIIVSFRSKTDSQRIPRFFQIWK
jgi:hypothetical protein